MLSVSKNEDKIIKLKIRKRIMIGLLKEDKNTKSHPLNTHFLLDLHVFMHVLKKQQLHSDISSVSMVLHL